MYETYEEIINGQIVLVTVIPEAEKDFTWEFCHEKDSGHRTQFWANQPEYDD